MTEKELPAVSMAKAALLIFLNMTMVAEKVRYLCTWNDLALQDLKCYFIKPLHWTHCFIFYLARLLQGENKNGSVTFINGGKGLNMFLSNWVQWNSSIWTQVFFLSFPVVSKFQLFYQFEIIKKEKKICTYSVSKIVLTFHFWINCSDDHKYFANSRP